VSPSIARHITVLGFDTATAALTVALTRGEQCLSERVLADSLDSRPRHAAELLGEIERAVATAGGWDAVHRLAVGIGPGSYTGLRIGIATARALGQGTGRPLVGVGSLDALAHGIGELPAAAGRSRLAVIDARRSEMFAALHGPDGERVWGPIVASTAAVGERFSPLPASPLAAGDGAIRFRRDLEQAGAEVLPEDEPAHRLSARQVCILAGAMAPSTPSEIEPIYLRPPDAQIWRERDRGKSPGG
jgi:tRNA threonylcarbamoyladenosine biosynthesis protein TsaB